MFVCLLACLLVWLVDRLCVSYTACLCVWLVACLFGLSVLPLKCLCACLRLCVSLPVSFCLHVCCCLCSGVFSSGNLVACFSSVACLRVCVCLGVCLPACL